MTPHAVRIVLLVLALLLAIPCSAMAQTPADRQARIVAQLDALEQSTGKIPGRAQLDRLGELARLEAQAGRVDRVRQIEEQVRAAPPADDDSALIALARVQMALRQWDAAAATLNQGKQAFRINPVYREILIARVQAGDFQGARAMARVIVPNTMDRASAYQQMLIAQAELGHTDQVIEFLDNTLDLTAAFSKHHGYIAITQILVEQNQQAKARQLMQDIHTLSRRETVPGTRIALAGDLVEGFMLAGDPQTARTMLGQAEQDLALVTDAKDSFAYNRCLAALAVGWARVGEIDKAIGLLGQMNQVNDQGKAANAIVLAMLRARNIEQARQFGKQNNRVSDSQIILHDIVVRLETSDLTGALMRFKEIDEYDFNRGRVLRQIAFHLSKAGQHQTLDDLVFSLSADREKDSVRLGVLDHLLRQR